MPEIYDLTVETQVIELLKERFYLGHKLDPNFLTLDIKRVRDNFDWVSESLLVRLETAVAMEKKKDICEYEFPETLWQFFKEYYLPKFFKKWFPVKYSILRIWVDLDIKYLDIPVYLQDKKPRIVIKALYGERPKYKMFKSEVKTINVEHPEVKTINYEYKEI